MLHHFNCQRGPMAWGMRNVLIYQLIHKLNLKTVINLFTF